MQGLQGLQRDYRDCRETTGTAWRLQGGRGACRDGRVENMVGGSRWEGQGRLDCIHTRAYALLPALLLALLLALLPVLLLALLPVHPILPLILLPCSILFLFFFPFPHFFLPRNSYGYKVLC